MLTVLEIQTTLVSLWKLQKTYDKNDNIKCIWKYHCPPLLPFEKKLWLLTLNEIFKGKNTIVYISISYNTFPKTSTNNALISRIYTIKMQDHQIKCISIMHGQLWQTHHRVQDLHSEVANMEHSPNTCKTCES